MFPFKIFYQAPSAPSSYDEKSEARLAYSADSAKQKSNGHHYIAMSPDGTQIALLNTSTYQLQLCKFNDLSNVRTISYDKFKYNAGISSTKLNWSLSVSNEIMLPDGTVDILIAVSCFDDENMKVKYDSRESKKSERFNPSSTWIISSKYQARISSSIDNIGGIIKILNNKGDDSNTNVVVINAEGMTKFTIIHKEIREALNNGNDNSWLDIFQLSRLKSIISSLLSNV